MRTSATASSTVAELVRSPSSRTFGLTAIALACVWWLASSGLVSSNDGSHVALARALALRHETAIDSDIALTLFIDRAARDGHSYSDRPPGTAFAALPAAWVGARLDPVLLERSLERRDVVLVPAAPRFAETYTARAQRFSIPAPPLVALQGTALMIVLHAIAMGLFGAWGVDALLRHRDVSAPARAFAVLALGLATLWGPYATMLFSHVTTGAMLVAAIAALERARDGSPAWALLAGLAAAWAVASDYLALLLVVPLVALAVPWRERPRIAVALGLGALPIALATLAYHAAAFGSPWSIGYDHHASFGFARSRAATFDGNPLAGAWTLFGLGGGAGILALAPITIVGLVCLARVERRWLFAMGPWALALCVHHTPGGGATEDHRYLVPMLPLVAVGLGAAWSRAAEHPRRRVFVTVLVALAVLSAVLAWTHTFSVRGAMG